MIKHHNLNFRNRLFSSFFLFFSYEQLWKIWQGLKAMLALQCCGLPEKIQIKPDSTSKTAPLFSNVCSWTHKRNFSFPIYLYYMMVPFLSPSQNWALVGENLVLESLQHLHHKWYNIMSKISVFEATPGFWLAYLIFLGCNSNKWQNQDYLISGKGWSNIIL